MRIEYAIIVRNKTRLEALTERFNTRAQARFYIESSGGNFADYETEHHNFHESLSVVQRRLSGVIKNKIIERSFLPSFLFSGNHLIIVIGQDGLVANTAKYVNGLPILAINPDEARYDGVLLPFNAKNFLEGVEKVLANKYSASITTLAEARLNDGQRLLAFNDLFIGAASHVSARYKISFQDKSEEHSSSGIIVSTQAGSTGWLSSVFNMNHGLNKFMKSYEKQKNIVQLEDAELMFAVREPFASKKTQTGLTAGILSQTTMLTVESLMPVNGVIFSDGVEADFLKFNSGAIATISTAEETARLVQRQ